MKKILIQEMQHNPTLHKDSTNSLRLEILTTFVQRLTFKVLSHETKNNKN